ncbi:hypothetical protein [Nonomuraea basaltis]|uniref:hypothetical protein n=1 Tax=Nonomuraea basaltis TaxID=2495887 RepID=UPI00110C6FD3|nr:hypothetical protein [Nonomuraea basaltis]TMR88952.1 hypothetical protein EJK15_63405 [Nonomuraea basaltis]
MAALRCGERDIADRSADDAEAGRGQGGPVGPAGKCVAARAVLHQTDGEHDMAVKLFEEAADGFRRAGMPVQHAWTLASGARSARRPLATRWR